MIQNNHTFTRKVIIFISLISLLISEPYFEFWENDSLKVKGEIISAKKYGKWEFYNLKGKVWKYEIYKNGKKIDEMKWQIYKPKQKEIEIMESAVLLTKEETIQNSIKKKIIPKDSIKSKNPLLKGYTGNWIEYYDSGELRCVIEYMNGLKHGKSNYYNEQKVLIRTERYLTDKKHGKWIWYWDNKKVKELGYFNSDRKQGKWVKYDENGNEIMVKDFY
jgi:antitoxin component YwqK of YwqJK toxin-antitoxin module